MFFICLFLENFQGKGIIYLLKVLQKIKSCQSISSSEYFPITTFSIFITKISEIDHSKQIKISGNSRPPKKINISKINSVLWYWFLLKSKVRLISVCYKTHIIIRKRHQKGYLKLLQCNYFIIYWACLFIHNFSPKLSLELNLSSCFFLNGS